MTAELKAIMPFTLADELWEEIGAGYKSTPRWYHTIHHIESVARTARDVGRWAHPREVYLAILFHDIVYDVTRFDNEAQSADRARPAAMAIEADADRVARLILATAQHGKLGPADVDADTALFLDCDMAVLGADPQDYAVYAEGVRREYLTALPVEVYDAGRKAFLQKVLVAPRLFLSDRFHSALDAKARANLRAELDALT